MTGRLQISFVLWTSLLLLSLGGLRIPAFSQRFVVSVEAGQARFDMQSVSQLQREELLQIGDSLRVEPKVFHDFPDNKTIGGTVAFDHNHHRFALRVSLSATGSRFHYADYSGKVESDKRLSFVAGSLNYLWSPIKPDAMLRPLVGFGIGMITTSWEYTSNFEMPDYNIFQKRQFRGERGDVSFEPQLVVEFCPLKWVGMTMGASYLGHRNTGLKDKATGADLMLPLTEKPVVAQWDGLRLTMGVLVRIGKIK